MRIVSRVEAGLAAPKRAIAAARASRRELFLHHSVTTITGDPFADWRAVQAAAFARGYADISYPWGVHPCGTILEGRSPFVEGAHTEGHNRTGHAIVLIGNYHAPEPRPKPIKPTGEQIEAVRWLRTHLVAEQLLTADHTFQPHRAVKKTACPGSHALARWIDIAGPLPPPTPQPSPPIWSPPLEVDVNIQPVHIEIPVDADGNGWVEVDYPIDRIIGVIGHSEVHPGRDGRYDGVPNSVTATPGDTGTVIVVKGQTPGWPAHAWLKVAV